MDLRLKSQKKLNHDILDSLNKAKAPGHCGFPLANLLSVESVDFSSCLHQTLGEIQRYCVFDWAIFNSPVFIKAMQT